jgi:hypothetical protein
VSLVRQRQRHCPRRRHGQGKSAGLVHSAEVRIPLACPGTLPATAKLQRSRRGDDVAIDADGIVTW